MMYFFITDKRARPMDPNELRRILQYEAIHTVPTHDGNVLADVFRTSELVSMSRALDAVVETGVDVDGRNVGTWIHIRDRPEESDYPEPMECPFCGEPARIMCGPEDWVQCTGCGAMSEFSASPENAVRKWNRRAPHV